MIGIKKKNIKGYSISEEHRYLYLPNHPKSKPNGYYAEHRYLFEQRLGRILNTNEIIHNILKYTNIAGTIYVIGLISNLANTWDNGMGEVTQLKNEKKGFIERKMTIKEFAPYLNQKASLCYIQEINGLEKKIDSLQSIISEKTIKTNYMKRNTWKSWYYLIE